MRRRVSSVKNETDTRIYLRRKRKVQQLRHVIRVLMSHHLIIYCISNPILNTLLNFKYNIHFNILFLYLRKKLKYSSYQRKNLNTASKQISATPYLKTNIYRPLIKSMECHFTICCNKLNTVHLCIGSSKWDQNHERWVNDWTLRLVIIC